MITTATLAAHTKHPTQKIAPEQSAAQRFTQKMLAQGFKKQALHVYQDEEGQPLYWRIRLKHPVTGKKWIRPLSCDSSGRFFLKEPHFIQGKPLYQLPTLSQNISATVWLVEGELCVDYLRKLGITATTSGGVDSVETTDWGPLAKRQVIIWPDNDEAGLNYATHVTTKLASYHCETQWINVALLNLPVKGDCINWLEQNPDATTQDIVALPLIKPASSQGQSSSPSNLSKNVEVKGSYFNADAGCFKANEKGVFYLREEEVLWICSQLEIKALLRDKASENWGRLLEFYDSDKHLHTWAMPMEMLKGSGEEVRGELLRLGLDIAAGNKARNLLLAYIMTSKPTQRARCVSRTGWYDNFFVLPQQTFGSSIERLIYQAETQPKDYQQNGSLENWQQHVAALCVSNSRLVLALSCAFAAMLLYPANMESGGIHFVGESSSGKTTALKVAASVFGGSNYVNRWRGTTNGIEALAALRSDTLLILDELAQVDAREAGEIAYMLANGSGKTRADKNGAARSRHEWRLLFLSAGEVGLAQHMLEVGKKIKAGQEVRLVDIPSDTEHCMGIFEELHGFTSAVKLSKALIQGSAQYYGTAAIAFLQKITVANYFLLLPQTIKILIDQFLNKNLPPNSSGQVFRVCERFGLIAAAGELATDFGITGWSSGESNLAASTCFKAWLAHRGGHGNQERMHILAQVKAFFEAHGESRFSHWEAENSHTINRAGFKKIQEGTLKFYVFPEIFRQEICMGLDYRSVSHCLMAERWIEPDQQGKPYRREYLPTIGRSRCYVFTKNMWEE